MANIAIGNHSETFSLPTGFGDCTLWQIGVLFTNGEVAMTAVADAGIAAYIYDLAALTERDIVGAERFIKIFDGAGTSAWIVSFNPPEALLWRFSERLALHFPSPDTDATPTIDMQLRVRVGRMA